MGRGDEVGQLRRIYRLRYKERERGERVREGGERE